MNITIAGYGFVGRAVDTFVGTKHSTFIVDPAYNENTISSMSCDAVIICVSTPANTNGSCDMTNVINVISDAPDVPILIKSTISIEGWRKLKELFPKKDIAFSPEFLRANTAELDFVSQDKMYVSESTNHFWVEFFKGIKPTLSIFYGNAEELIITKYMRNSFLATKVSFFNQVFDLCESLGVDFETVRRYTTEDSRITDSHSYVTDERGFAGHCFPKDTQAILKTANEAGYDLSLVREAVQYNERVKWTKK
jgi:UDPglucose 6-dehydrogenase